MQRCKKPEKTTESFSNPPPSPQWALPRCKCRSSSIHSPIVCPWTVPKLDCFKAADKLFVGLRTTYRGRGGQHRGMCYCTALSFCFHRSPSLLTLQLQLLITEHTGRQQHRLRPLLVWSATLYKNIWGFLLFLINIEMKWLNVGYCEYKHAKMAQTCCDYTVWISCMSALQRYDVLYVNGNKRISRLCDADSLQTRSWSDTMKSPDTDVPIITVAAFRHT